MKQQTKKFIREKSAQKNVQSEKISKDNLQNI